MQSPGHQSYRTPRKIAYLVGTTFRPALGTDVVAEYSFADATTYSSRIPDTQWQKGLYNNIGLPAGPNSREVFLRVRQKIARGLHVALEGRDRRRRDDSFPEPTSRDYAATVEFAPNQKNGFEVTYHDYRQNAFPISPTVPPARRRLHPRQRRRQLRPEPAYPAARCLLPPVFLKGTVTCEPSPADHHCPSRLAADHLR